MKTNKKKYITSTKSTKFLDRFIKWIKHVWFGYSISIVLFYFIFLLYWDIGSNFSLIRDAHKIQPIQFKVEYKSISEVAHKRRISQEFLLHTSYNGHSVVHSVDWQSYNKAKVGGYVTIETSIHNLNIKNSNIDKGYKSNNGIVLLRLGICALIITLLWGIIDYGDDIKYKLTTNEYRYYENVYVVCIFSIILLLFWFVFLLYSICDILSVFLEAISFSSFYT